MDNMFQGYDFACAEVAGHNPSVNSTRNSAGDVDDEVPHLFSTTEPLAFSISFPFCASARITSQGDMAGKLEEPSQIVSSVMLVDVVRFENATALD